MSDQATTGDQLTDAQIIAASLVETCRQIIKGGADPNAVMDAALLLAVAVVEDHADPDQAEDFAAWLRQWADKIEGHGPAPARRH